MSKSLELRTERAEIVREMCALTNSPADGGRWKELNDKQEALRVKIQTAENSSLTDEMEAVPSRASLQLPNIGTEDFLSGLNQRTGAPAESREFRAAFDKFLRTGKESPALERRDYTPLGIGGGASVPVPVNFQSELEKRLVSFAGMLQRCRILRTDTGNNLTWPRVSDVDVQGEVVAENEPISQANPTFDSVTVGSHLVSSKQVLLSVQLLQDSGVDIASALAGMLGERIGRALNGGLTTGASTIIGILTALATDGTRNVTAIGAHANSANDADTDLTSIGSADFSALIDKVDPAYRDGAVFMGNSAIFSSIRKTLDKYGRPLWQTGLSFGDPDTIAGFPYQYNQAMAASIGAGAKTLLYGNFEKYLARMVNGVTLVRYNELYMTSHQVGFEAWLRCDGKLLQPAAFAVLVHPAS
jgi:HK97 family phage major capsid protein